MELKQFFALLEQMSFRDVCKNYSISERKMRSWLNEHYDFNKSEKRYYFKDDAANEPLAMDVYSFAAAANYNASKPEENKPEPEQHEPEQHEEHKENTNKTSGGHMERILEEILKHTKNIDEALTKHPSSIHEAAATTEPQPAAPASVMQRIYEIQIDKNKARKTLTLNATAAQLLDEYAAANSLDKSAIASLALIEFFERNKS